MRCSFHADAPLENLLMLVPAFYSAKPFLAEAVPCAQTNPVSAPVHGSLVRLENKLVRLQRGTKGRSRERAKGRLLVTRSPVLPFVDSAALYAASLSSSSRLKSN